MVLESYEMGEFPYPPGRVCDRVWVASLVPALRNTRGARRGAGAEVVGSIFGF